jgi:hypothetical protein
VRDAVGCTVRVYQGTVWITQQNDLRDVFLNPGESFVIEQAGATLLTALPYARIAVEPLVAHCVRRVARKRSSVGTGFGLRAIFRRITSPAVV